MIQISFIFLSSHTRVIPNSRDEKSGLLKIKLNGIIPDWWGRHKHFLLSPSC